MKKYSLYKGIAILLCLIFLLPSSITGKSQKAIAAASAAGTVNATSLNVRSGPGTEFSKVQVNGSDAFLRKNEKVTIIEELDEWYKINFKYSGITAEGYVKKEFIKMDNETIDQEEVSVETPTPVPESSDIKTAKSVLNLTAVVTATNVNIRKTPSTTGIKAGKLNKNMKVTVLSESLKNSEKWYRISYKSEAGNISGYVLSNYIKLIITSAIQANISCKKNIVVKKGAGNNYKNLIVDKKQILLSNGKFVVITEEITNSKSEKWFKITFNQKQRKYSGYVLAGQIVLKADNSDTTVTPTEEPEEELTPTAAVKPTVTVNPTITAKPTIKPTATPTPAAIVSPTPTPASVPSVSPFPTSVPLSDAEFEQKMTSDGFPESYKPFLRQLHQMQPTWVFDAYQTGLDWNTVIDNESTVGKNLITNAKSIEWKSFEPNAYNWETDSFIPFDGSTWVTASKDAISYYMDPRNFLTEKAIFQFEMLTYKSQYQDATGVEGILYNTPLYNTSYTCQDNSPSYTYSQTFIKAAEYSGVSPFHLATRAKQEVVTTSGLSPSVSGTVTGYENLYNYYNIGAYHSTTPGVNITNALKYAKNGTTNMELNSLYMIPWDSPYDSIVGGAYIIGSTYIKRGQDTIYLQKFNVSATSTYSHQYMANIQAPESEAKKTYTAYTGMMNVPIVFSIPVYNNMPESVCAVPTAVKNPNNWLKNLDVNGYSLTPSFDLTVDQPYSLIVDNSVTGIDISASPVNSKATVQGTGYIPLQAGNNKAIITVTAENGDVREYTIDIVREEVVQ